MERSNVGYIVFWGLIFCINSCSFSKEGPKGTQNWYSFSDDGTECIVYRSDLKRPWFNRLSNDVFFTWVTHNGYIESFLLDPHINGLVNPQKVSGHFYIRDNETKEFSLLNESDGKGSWRGVIGLGYNRLSKNCLELETELTYFIPRHENLLLITLEVKNTSDRHRTLSAYGQVEWNLGDRAKKEVRPSDGLGGSQHNLYKKVYVDDHTMYAEQANWRSTANCQPWPFIGYFTTDGGIRSFETSTAKFLGYKRDWYVPMSLVKGPLSNTTFWSYDEFPLGAIEKDISLAPGESKTMVFMLGTERDKQAIHSTKAKYANVENTEKALQDVKNYYTTFLENTLSIETPDKENDRIINTWTQYHWRQWLKQDLDTKSLGAGFWAYGLEGGNVTVFPEQFLVGLDMDLLKNSLENVLLVNQNPDTSKNTLFQTPPAMLDSDIGVEWPPQEVPEGHSSPHHHAIYIHLFSIYYYLLETGDLGYLDKELSYIDGSTGTVFEHVEKALEITLKGISERGLSKIAKNAGDWMDEFTKISKNGDAESIMLSAQVAYLLKKFSEIAGKIGKQDARRKWTTEYERIKTAINEYGGDGDWYIRAFSDRKPGFQAVGSRHNEEGKIYLNAQSWPVLSGVATPERAAKSLLSVKKHLLSEYGPLVFWPSYSRYVDYIGTQSIYPPGFRNGNIYFRPAGWAIIAAAMSDKADLANELYKNASLAVRSKDIETYLLEPYAYPENYVGPDHPHKGEGQFHWCFGEGTAWMWYAYVNYILGIRAELDGLVIDPQIPAEWDGFKVKKPFRGAIYEIEVSNPDHVRSGVKSMIIDGKKIKGNVVIPHKDNHIHKVSVILG